MKNRIILNLILAFTIIPAFSSVRDYIRLEILHDHSMYAGTFQEYYQLQTVCMTFLITPIVYLILVLLPYNFALIYSGKTRRLNLFNKILLLNSSFVIGWCILGTFMNIWLSPPWRNLKFLLYVFPVSVLFASLIHFFVDRKTEMSKYER